MTGTLYGIGVGPGDPELITLKAHRILQSVPVVAWPAPLEGDSMARRIAAPHLTHDPVEIPIRMPIEATQFPDRSVYDQAAAEIGSHLDSGRDVAALCEGDPFFYGSFMYLFGRMAPQYDITIVPGISSLMASAAALESPLASRNDLLTVVPAPLEELALTDAVAAADSVAIIKVGRHLTKVRRVLGKLGLLDSAQYVAYATMSEQTIKPLTSVTEERAPYFSLILSHKRGAAWR
ncbi:MAG: precorrin-2 C(20)-methyltransferase [Rhodospirillaceae bacterium]|nr:precorrin-2 C(20)-methyltransferase [Rhodospirillaceae bacterium]MDD9925532.1 precorrin-2 C(20)-methyltransferase [Rhodospirillaceae bacterium]